MTPSSGAAWLGDEHGYESVDEVLLGDEPDVPDWDPDFVALFRAQSDEAAARAATKKFGRWTFERPHPYGAPGSALAAFERLRASLAQATPSSIGATPDS